MPDWFVRGGVYVTISDKTPRSSLDWLHNQDLQASYLEFGGNRTWERALYEIAKNGDEKQAYYTLGFILHLMEDAAVPDHTRNDSHAPGVGGDEGSPYEQYADRFTRENFNVAADLRNAGYKPAEKNTIDYYLHSLALYSNKNFFSKDTIFDGKYSEPKIITEYKIGDYLYGIGKEDTGIKFPLVRILLEKMNNYQFERVYSLKSKDPGIEIVLHDYFTLLSRQAIINGAGVINFFHKEAEQARQNPENLIAPPELKTANKAISMFSEVGQHGWWVGVPNALSKTVIKNVVFKPADFTVNLAANAVDIFKAFSGVDSNKLTTGFSDNQLADSAVEEISVIVQEGAKDLAETVKNTDRNLLTAGIVKTPIPVSEFIAENKEFVTVPAANTKVKFIIDGDTFILNDDTKVRLIGIDAPEAEECFYEESKNMLADLISGKEILLEKDISDTDSYGRLLRYGRINNILISDYMVREGFAKAWAYGSDIKYREMLDNSENYAKENRLGLWKACGDIKKTKSSFMEPGGLESIIASIGNNNPPPVEPDPEPEPEQEQDQYDDENNEPEEPIDNIPPITPFDLNIADDDFFTPADDVNATNDTQINIFGKGEAGSTILISINPVYEAEVASNGTWQSEITLNEGANAVKIKARDEAGNESEEITINVILDSISPIAQINITNYNLMSTVFNVGWLAAEEDAATSTFEPQYKINESGDWQDLEIENGGEFENAQDETIYYFRVRVQDVNGNQGDWSEIAETEINTKPIIFNEIAWMGTDADSWDEWIELYNVSDSEVDITNWQIVAGDNNPNITIFDASVDSFIIAPHDYFLLERSDDETVSDIVADFVYSGAGSSQNMMENSELLRLKDSIGNVVDEIGAFYAGNNTEKKTMERVRSDVGSDASANWLTYDGEGEEAQDADGNPIFGTPKFPNSVNNKYYAIGNSIAENTIFYAGNSPYFVYNNLDVPENKTLAIEAGVEIKVASNVQITIDGTLKSQGEEENNIIFTSFSDSPLAGDWTKIYFSPTSQNSELSYTNILYGGKYTSGFGGQSTAVEVATSTVAFDNILISESEYRGLWLKNSDSAINNSTFDNINTRSGSAMLAINGGSPQINNSVFQNTNGNNSYYGINILSEASPIISNNSFSNTNYPIYITEGDPILSDNAANDNLYDGIWFHTLYGVSNDVILEKDLPYYVNSIIEVKNGAVLTINGGAEIRFNSSGSIGQDGLEIKNGGVLRVMGKESEEIKFTADSSAPSVGHWKWIYFMNDAGEDSIIINALIEYAKTGIKVADGAPEITFDNIIFNGNNVNTDPVDLLE